MNDLNSFHIYLHGTGIELWALDSHAGSGLYQWVVSHTCFALFCRARAVCMLGVCSASERHPQSSTVPLQIDFNSRNFF